MIFSILTSNLISPQDKFIFFVSFTCAVVAAIMFHEWAHAWVAFKNGDLTPKLQGRLNLNPKAHFDVYGLLMFFIVGFGWAKPVPINPDNFEHKRRGVFLTAIAGVTMNFILAFVGFCFSNLLLLIPPATLAKSDFLYVCVKLFYNFFYYGVIINVSLIAFNILPLYPLDGFRVVESFTKPTNPYVKFMYRYGSALLLGLIIVSQIIGMFAPQLDVFSMYFNFVHGIIDKLFTLIWGAVFQGA